VYLREKMEQFVVRWWRVGRTSIQSEAGALPFHFRDVYLNVSV